MITLLDLCRYWRKKDWASWELGPPCPALVQLDLVLGKLSLEVLEVVV